MKNPLPEFEKISLTYAFVGSNDSFYTFGFLSEKGEPVTLRSLSVANFVLTQLGCTTMIPEQQERDELDKLRNELKQLGYELSVFELDVS